MAACVTPRNNQREMLCFYCAKLVSVWLAQTNIGSPFHGRIVMECIDPIMG